MADVFVSYKRDDKAAVARIVRGLRDAGFTVWWDDDISPDAPWEETIERELGDARSVVVAWSPASAASENVRAEARRARSDGKLIQAYIEACEPPLFFGERQGIDLCRWDGSAADPAFERLAAATRTLADKPVLVAVARKRSPKPRRLFAYLVVAVLTVLAGLSLVFGPAAFRSLRGGNGLPTENTAALTAIQGKWGRPGCPSPQMFAVRRDIITVTADDWVSTGRVVSIRGGTVLSEALTPITDRGRLIELSAEGDRLVIYDRTTDVRQVLERCP